MPGVELTARVCGRHVVVALRGDLDVTGEADAEAAITALVAPDRSLVADNWYPVISWAAAARAGWVRGWVRW